MLHWNRYYRLFIIIKVCIIYVDSFFDRYDTIFVYIWILLFDCFAYATITNDFRTYKVEHPKYLLKAEKRLRRLQRRLSRKQKGSKNSEKARLILAKCHEYVVNARKDFLHKLSKAVIDENQVVVAEGLSVKGLMKSFLSKHVADSGWSMFLRFLEYKARWYGRQLVVVDRYYPSSKTCSECGYIYGDMDLSVREWICPVCGAYHDRDVNASKNLYNYGFAHLTSGRVGTPRTYACGECGLHSMKQEATTSISGG